MFSFLPLPVLFLHIQLFHVLVFAFFFSFYLMNMHIFHSRCKEKISFKCDWDCLLSLSIVFVNLFSSNSSMAADLSFGSDMNE